MLLDIRRPGRVDLQIVANKIKANKGKIVVPKTEIRPNMGFYAMFIDTEGKQVRITFYMLNLIFSPTK